MSASLLVEGAKRAYEFLLSLDLGHRHLHHLHEGGKVDAAFSSRINLKISRESQEGD